MKPADYEGRTHVRVVQGRLPGWLALVLLAPAALLFAFSLTVVLLGGLVAAIVLPLLFRRSIGPRGGNDCIELEPDDFRTLERRDSLPPD